jgi:hypothetical protein
MKKALYIIAGLFALGLIGRLCSQNEELNKKWVDKDTATVTNHPPIKIDSSKITKWSFSDEVDKMTNKTNYFAIINSENTVELSAPYNGGSISTFTFRKMDGKLGALLRVNPSQFSHTDVYGGTVMIKFDDEAGRKYSYGLPSDGSSDVIFIENSKLLLSKLKTSKKMLIEAEFYNNGNKIIEFDVKGFEWKH